ncbi:antirepresssor protein RebB [Agrobacterium vitis]|uniref:Antirepresssor protein RebB n=1 Tax=Agrobacterium vitis TaxID=373 RepID=A0ABD6GA91_AGRVI|nr:RebB family R body protein [Agrobacterium vitis]MUO79074.1 antirepresssor protein RebB [Agrobacterium vitis]MUO94636.1 antirepresssor protein RebB [Agrobacterium vitis]MUP06295.1 antirepresssor protein RebB [Agrobacterium vitis]MUZ82392.1 antirepresssor protein RebB [Agrobacterium vitis]MVA11248.1 antirepresssor protein RebB [Agrobacterium vitis]
MTVPTTVNPVITDAVTQANVKVVGEAPAMAMGSLYQTASHSTGLMFENAVTAQNNQNILAQAATTQGVMQIYSIDTISDAIAVARMLQASA